MSIKLASIVEGDGEVRALPPLLQRIAARLAPSLLISIDKSWRIPRDILLKNDKRVKEALDVLALSVKGHGGILVLCDSDDDCPARMAPRLARRLSGLRSDVPISVVMAHREFEAWFLAAGSSCAGKVGLSAAMADHPDPESPRDCKGRLSQFMAPGAPYRETLHQEALSRAFDIDIARQRSPSFAKLCREVVRLIGSTGTT